MNIIAVFFDKKVEKNMILIHFVRNSVLVPSIEKVFRSVEWKVTHTQ